MKILIIQQKMIGDVLTSSILFEALREKYPQAELHYLIQAHTRAVVENNPFIHKIIESNPDKEKSILELIKFAAEIKKQQYDVVIDVYSKINSAFLTTFSGAKKKIGFLKWYTSSAYSDTFSNKKQPDTEAGLAIENRMLLLKALSPDFETKKKPKIYLLKSEREAAVAVFQEAGVSKDLPLFMISILGSSCQKTYPPQYMAQILDHIVGHSQAQLLFNYIPKQREEAEELFLLCSEPTRKKIFFNVFGKDLREFLATTSHCDALIGNEGGAVNMAKALNIPTFAIFSPQISKKAWASYEGEDHIAVHLADFYPELFPRKKNQKSAADYQLMEPELLLSELNRFLKKLPLDNTYSKFA